MGLPKVAQQKAGKLHLGKISKPNIIMSHEDRKNPWANPKPISENIISQKGLM